jgi:hypothetical protein
MAVLGSATESPQAFRGHLLGRQPRAENARGLAGGLARRLNEQIVRVAEMLPGATEHEYGFTCECGCGKTVLLSLATFVEGGAWIAGHKPK